MAKKFFEWYYANFGWQAPLGVVFTGIAMHPSIVGFLFWLAGVFAFHAGIYATHIENILDPQPGA